MRGIQPNWPAPTWVRAITTSREDGVSHGAFSHFNLGFHVNDNKQAVSQNRLALSQQFNFQYEPVWLNQTHSTNVFEIKSPRDCADEIIADASFTQLTGVPCVVLTADCLPIVLCDTQGTMVAAIHAGWRGLANGIIEKTVNAMRLNAHSELMAWMGPAISQPHFEVGTEVRDAFLKHNLQAAIAFKPGANEGKWMGDLFSLARMRLKEVGLSQIYGGDHCTYTDETQFYSYRRDKQTGRMATLIWLER